MGKKYEPALITLPCPKRRCSWRATQMYSDVFLRDDDAEKYRIEAMQHTLTGMLLAHEEGKHSRPKCCAKAECCHCHHHCSCEHLTSQ